MITILLTNEDAMELFDVLDKQATFRAGKGEILEDVLGEFIDALGFRIEANNK